MPREKRNDIGSQSIRAQKQDIFTRDLVRGKTYLQTRGTNSAPLDMTNQVGHEKASSVGSWT